MSVSQYALTSLEKLKSFLKITDSDIQVTAFSIYNASSDATASTVAVDSVNNELTLTITGGANEGTDTFDLTDASDDTIGKLVTEIDNLGKDWVVELIGNSNASSIDLQSLSSTGCFNSGNIQYLTMANNYLLEQIIDNVTDAVEEYCDRLFMSRTYTNDRYDGDGTNELYLDNYPVTQITKLCTQIYNVIKIKYSDTSDTASDAYIRIADSTLSLNVVTSSGTSTTNIDFSTYTSLSSVSDQINAQSNWTAEVSSGYENYASTELLDQEYGYCKDQNVWVSIADNRKGDFELYEDTGLIHLNGSWFPEGNRNIVVTYTAGYTSSTKPKLLEDAVLELCALEYKKLEKDMTVKSEKLGDYSYTIADILTSMTPSIENKLSHFKNPKSVVY